MRFTYTSQKTSQLPQKDNKKPFKSQFIAQNLQQHKPTAGARSYFAQNQRQLYKSDQQANGLTFLRRSTSSKSGGGSKIPIPLRSSMKQKGKVIQNKNNNNQTLKAIVQNNANTFKSIFSLGICKLCQCSSQDQLVSIAGCQHKFCINCLNQYVKYKIGKLQPVLCPQQNCDEPMDELGKFFHDLPENLQQKYLTQMLWAKNRDNPNVIICPRQNCPEGIINLLNQPPFCNKCGKTLCKQCQFQAHQGPCQKNFQQKFSDWKRCPKCHLFIERTQGCNHMTCRCGHQFCYICLQDWEQRHYSCGQAGLNLDQLFADDYQVPESMLKRCFELLVYILCLPIMFVLALVSLILILSFSGIAGFFIFPFVLLFSGVNRQNFLLCCIIFCPLLGLTGFILGQFLGLIFFVYFVLRLTLVRNITRICKLCGCIEQE